MGSYLELSFWIRNQFLNIQTRNASSSMVWNRINLHFQFAFKKRKSCTQDGWELGWESLNLYVKSACCFANSFMHFAINVITVSGGKVNKRKLPVVLSIGSKANISDYRWYGSRKCQPITLYETNKKYGFFTFWALIMFYTRQNKRTLMMFYL